MLTLTTILHPLYSALDDRGFREELGRFLPVARRSPTNFVLVTGLAAAPAGVLVAMWGSPAVSLSC